MRPSKKILLIGEDEDKLSLLRYVLANSKHRVNYACYLVTTAYSVKEALEFLAESRFDVLICQSPLADKDSMLCHRPLGSKMKTISIVEDVRELLSSYADATLFKPTMAELLERIGIFARCKHGPAKGFKKAVVPERPVRLDEAVA